MKQKPLFASVSKREGVVKKKRNVVGSKQPNNVPITTDVLQTINQRERQIMVHSYLYYERDTSIITDSIFDRWMRELVDLKNKYPREFKKSALYEDFKNFEGGTGMGLPYTQIWVINKAEFLLSYRGGR